MRRLNRTRTPTASTSLPKEPGESSREYLIRVRRSVNFDAFRDAVQDRSDRPFTNPLILSEEDRVDEEVREILENVDLSNRTITEFAREVAREAHAFGYGMFMPEWSAELERPYLFRLSPGDVFDFEEDDATGTIAMIRFRKMENRRNDMDEVTPTPIVYEYIDPNTAAGLRFVFDEEELVETTSGEGGFAVIWRTYNEDDGNDNSKPAERVPEDQGVLLDDNGQPIDEIPIVIVYANRQSTLEADPPLDGLAWLNLRWFHSYSDQAHILRYARVPRLVRTGAIQPNEDPEETVRREQGETHAVNQIMDLPDGATAAWLEPDGSAIEAGQADLEMLLTLMERSGAREDFVGVGAQTATAAVFAESRKNGGMISFIRSLEISMTIGLLWIHRFLAIDMPEGVRVKVNEERSIAPGDEERSNAVILARRDRVITNETAVEELVRLGVLNDSVDPEAESRAVRREMSLIGMLEDDMGNEFGAGVTQQQPLTGDGNQ